MARIETAAITTLLVLALAGCSASASTGGGSSSAANDVASAGSASQGGGGSVDCAALAGGDAASYSVGIQLLAQLRSQSAVDVIKEGTLVYDPDAMEAILTNLKSLAGHGAEGFSDPGPDVDFFLTANSKARAILATDGPVPQSMFDDLASFEGDIGAFIMRQASISAALGEACPSL
jgi:hypothetical protein